jgi:hypothetical protein
MKIADWYAWLRRAVLVNTVVKSPSKTGESQ